MKKFNLMIFFLENVMTSMKSTIDETEMINSLANEAYPHLSHNEAVDLVKLELRQIKYFKKDEKLYKVIQENDNLFILNIEEQLAQNIPDDKVHIFNNNSEKAYGK